MDLKRAPNERIGTTVSGGKDSIYAWMWLAHEFGGENVVALHHHKIGLRHEWAGENLETIRNATGSELVEVRDAGFRARFNANLHAILDKPDAAMVRVALCAGCRWGISIGLFEEARALGIKKVVNAASALELAPFKAALMAEIGEGDETRGLLNGLARNSHYWRRQEGNLVTIVRDHDLCHETCFHKRPGFVASSGVTLYSFFDYLANNPKQIRDRVRALGCRLPTGDDWHFDCLVEPFKDLLYYGLLGYTEADFHVSQMIRYGLISRRAGVKEIRAKRQRIIMGISHVFDLAEGIGCDDTTLSMLQGFVADSPYLSSRPEGVRQLTELRQKPAPVAKRK